MDATAIAELQALAQDARSLEETARKQAERAERLLKTLSKAAEKASPGKDLFKRADGRMTDAGIAAVNAAFESGATVTDVAKQFDIHVSAASNRRKIWLAGKAGAIA